MVEQIKLVGLVVYDPNIRLDSVCSPDAAVGSSGYLLTRSDLLNMAFIAAHCQQNKARTGF